MLPTIIFFGSFQEYSATILTSLCQSSLLKVAAVVTTPPHQPVSCGAPIFSPVHQVAEKYQLPVFTPDELNASELEKITSWQQSHSVPLDLMVTAGYGKLLPDSWLTVATAGALNLHFSLLPAYRGANPAEWALLRGETLTGITLIEMGPEFDTGRLIAQYPVTIEPQETRPSLYQKLYAAGAEVLPLMIDQYWASKLNQPRPTPAELLTVFLPPITQPASPTPYAKRFSRNDGFIAWEGVQSAMAGQPIPPTALSELLQTTLEGTAMTFDASFLERASRALMGFPGLWTRIPTAKGEKRMKILSVSVENQKLQLIQVQIEGQAPANWNQVKNVIQAS